MNLFSQAVDTAQICTEPHPFNDKTATPLEWALMYRRTSFNVVPAFFPGEEGSKGSWKRPHIYSWQEYTRLWIPDRQVELWWGPGGTHADRPQMGVVTGSGSNNLFVIDLDLYKEGSEGDAWFRRAVRGIQPEEDTMLPTPVQQTGGGGLQILFRGPPGWTPPTNKTSIGIDIRGEGGFAMLPPSRHESGNTYSWIAGSAPWETAIMVAPPSLVTAIDELVAGGGSSRSSRSRSASSTPRQVTPDPASEFSTFGQRIDGREQYMADVVFAAMVDFYRERQGMLPTDEESMARAERAYITYENKVGTRLQGPPEAKAELLDHEERGRSEFLRKWRHTLKQWATKIAAEAATGDGEQAEVPAGSQGQANAAWAGGLFAPGAGILKPSSPMSRPRFAPLRNGPAFWRSMG